MFLQNKTKIVGDRSSKTKGPYPWRSTIRARKSPWVTNPGMGTNKYFLFGPCQRKKILLCLEGKFWSTIIDGKHIDCQVWRCWLSRLFFAESIPVLAKKMRDKLVLSFWKRVSAFWKRVSLFLWTLFLKNCRFLLFPKHFVNKNGLKRVTPLKFFSKYPSENV